MLKLRPASKLYACNPSVLNRKPPRPSGRQWKPCAPVSKSRMIPAVPATGQMMRQKTAAQSEIQTSLTGPCPQMPLKSPIHDLCAPIRSRNGKRAPNAAQGPPVVRSDRLIFRDRLILRARAYRNQRNNAKACENSGDRIQGL